MSEYKIGSLVRLHGLKNTFYNGRLGRVIDVDELNTTGRLTVKLQEEVHPPYLQEFPIKPENISAACCHCHKAGDKMQLCGKCRVAR